MSSETEPVAAGHGAELEDLYRREWPVLVNVAYLLTGSQSAAEAIAQDAFLRLQATSTVVKESAGVLAAQTSASSRPIRPKSCSHDRR